MINLNKTFLVSTWALMIALGNTAFAIVDSEEEFTNDPHHLLRKASERGLLEEEWNLKDYLIKLNNRATAVTTLTESLSIYREAKEFFTSKSQDYDLDELLNVINSVSAKIERRIALEELQNIFPGFLPLHQKLLVKIWSTLTSYANPLVPEERQAFQAKRNRWVEQLHNILFSTMGPQEPPMNYAASTVMVSALHNMMVCTTPFDMDAFDILMKELNELNEIYGVNTPQIINKFIFNQTFDSTGTKPFKYLLSMNECAQYIRAIRQQILVDITNAVTHIFEARRGHLQITEDDVTTLRTDTPSTNTIDRLQNIIRKIQDASSTPPVEDTATQAPSNAGVDENLIKGYIEKLEQQQKEPIRGGITTEQGDAIRQEAKRTLEKIIYRKISSSHQVETAATALQDSEKAKDLTGEALLLELSMDKLNKLRGAFDRETPIVAVTSVEEVSVTLPTHTTPPGHTETPQTAEIPEIIKIVKRQIEQDFPEFSPTASELLAYTLAPMYSADESIFPANKKKAWTKIFYNLFLKDVSSSEDSPSFQLAAGSLNFVGGMFLHPSTPDAVDQLIHLLEELKQAHGIDSLHHILNNDIPRYIIDYFSKGLHHQAHYEHGHPPRGNPLTMEKYIEVVRAAYQDLNTLQDKRNEGRLNAIASAVRHIFQLGKDSKGVQALVSNRPSGISPEGLENIIKESAMPLSQRGQEARTQVGKMFPLPLMVTLLDQALLEAKAEEASMVPPHLANLDIFQEKEGKTPDHPQLHTNGLTYALIHLLLWSENESDHQRANSLIIQYCNKLLEDSPTNYNHSLYHLVIRRELASTVSAIQLIQRLLNQEQQYLNSLTAPYENRYYSLLRTIQVHLTQELTLPRTSSERLQHRKKLELVNKHLTQVKEMLQSLPNVKRMEDLVNNVYRDSSMEPEVTELTTWFTSSERYSSRKKLKNINWMLSKLNELYLRLTSSQPVAASAAVAMDNDREEQFLSARDIPLSAPPITATTAGELEKPVVTEADRIAEEAEDRYYQATTTED